jgi:serine/threonine-protein kinase
MPLSVGDKLGPYEILAPIGVGGMGEVWKARDTRLDRMVALKWLKSAYSGRFEQEARAVAALNHPHICQIYDIGPDFLVLEYIDGSRLRGPLPLEQALRTAMQIAGALEAAHSKGILHRDLKPGNIVVTGSGAKLLDFGLAKITGDADATQTMVVSGTPLYMSPEQADGKPLDHRSDIFSFGAVLYEVLCGRRAFDSVAAVLRDDPAPLDSPAAPVVNKCLAKQPDARYQAMAEVRAALIDLADKPVAERPSIAVLPFANMSGDKEQEYFSDGLAEEILNLLVKIPALKVIARTSSFAFRGKEQDITRIAEALRVRTILEGSVRRSGSRIRVTAQLIDASDGSHLWSERYDRELTDVFAIQDEIAGAIAGQLKVNLTGAKRAVTNIPAYEAFLEGTHHSLGLSPDSAARAVECFERALSLDPEYAMAHSGIAAYYVLAAAMGIADPLEALPRADAALRRALELEENPEQLALAATLRLLREYDWNGAARDFHRALEMNSSSPGLSYYAFWYLRNLGRFDEAVRILESILAQDPLAVSIRVLIAGVMLSQRRYRECEQECRRILSIDSSFVFGRYYLALSLGLQQRLEEALDTARRLTKESGKWPIPLIGLGMVCALAGRMDEAHDAIGKLQHVARKRYVPPCYIAFIHAVCGETDAALEWAGKAVDRRDPLILSAKFHPAFDRIRDDPRFHALLQRMNLV